MKVIKVDQNNRKVYQNNVECGLSADVGCGSGSGSSGGRMFLVYRTWDILIHRSR